MKLPIEELDARLDKCDKELDRIWREDDGGSYEKYEEKCKPYRDEAFCLATAKDMITPRESIEARPMDELDRECRVPIEVFKEWCKSGYVSSYDGHGVYATENEATWMYARPRAFYEGYIRDDFDYVCWYNK